MTTDSDIKTVDDLLDKCYRLGYEDISNKKKQELQNLQLLSSNKAVYDAQKRNILKKYADFERGHKRIGRASFYRIKNGETKPQRHMLYQLELALGKIPMHLKRPDLLSETYKYLEIQIETERKVEPPVQDFFSGRWNTRISTYYINCHHRKIFGGFSSVKTSLHNAEINSTVFCCLGENLIHTPESEEAMLDDVSSLLFHTETDKQVRLYRTEQALKSLPHPLFQGGSKRNLVIYNLVHLARLLALDYKSILLEIMERLQFSQDELAGALNSTQNQISLLLNEQVEYLNPQLCITIHEVYFRAISPKTFANVEQRQISYDSRINQNEAMSKAKAALMRCGYSSEEFFEHYRTDYSGLNYFKKHQKKEISCDLFVKSSSNAIRLACFFKYRPVSSKQLMFYFFIAQELHATHITFFEGDFSITCVQVHCWPPSYVNIPLNLSPLKYRALEEKELFTILDNYLVIKADEIRNKSNNNFEYQLLLGQFESKVDIQVSLFSNGFLAIHHKVPFLINSIGWNKVSLGATPMFQQSDKIVYEYGLMSDIAKGNGTYLDRLSTYDYFPIESIDSSTSVTDALDNPVKPNRRR